MKYSQVEKSCEVCSKSFKIKNYRKDSAKYCSVECHNQLRYANDRVKIICLNCKKEATFSPSRKDKNFKFCSIECKRELNSTEVGVRKQQKAHQIESRGRNFSRNIRRHLFKLVEAKCQVCYYDKRTYCLEVHHIDENPNNQDLSNLAVLCTFCHRELHKGDLDDAIKARIFQKNYKREHKEA
jgi:ribosomal protein S8E